jgi:outer membrane protein assembly factor BamB
MKSKKYLLIISLIILSIVLSACSSAIYASTGWHGLAASPDIAYLAAGTQVYAVNLNTGSEIWRFPEKVNAKISFYANPVLTADGKLLVPSYDKNLYILDADTGKEQWNFAESINRLIASPLVIGNIAYQPSTDHFVYAIDLVTQQLVWKQETGAPIWAQPADNANCNCVFVASMDHFVYSFDAAKGTLIWKTDLGAAIVGTPAVSSDGSLYVGTFGKQMIALDATNGSIRWRYDTQDWIWSGPALDQDNLFFGDLAGYFYALKATDGSPIWRIQPKNAVVDTPVVYQDKVYFTAESDALFIVSTADGSINNQVIGGVIYSSPVVTGDVILVAPTGYDALLVALNLDGSQKWPFTPAK